MRTCLLGGLAFVFLALPEPVRAQSPPDEADLEIEAEFRDSKREFERFSLWNECRQMSFFVGVIRGMRILRHV